MNTSWVTFILLCLFAGICGCTPKSTEAVAGKITGTVRLAPALEPKIKNTDILFIIAREQPTGPPSAVSRIVHPRFPLQYALGPEDALIPGTPGFQVGARLTVTARVSRTGNAKPVRGDLEGEFKDGPTSPSSAGVDIVIDRERKE